jgi:hypothetical protein
MDMKRYFAHHGGFGSLLEIQFNDKTEDQYLIGVALTREDALHTIFMNVEEMKTLRDWLNEEFPQFGMRLIK